MEFVSPVIGPIVASLMVPIKKHLGFLVYSSKYVKDVDAKMKQLDDTTQEVQDKWERGIAKNEVIPKRVEPWFEDVKRIHEKAKSIQTNGSACFNVLRRYKIGKLSCDILNEIEDLKKLESKIDFTGEQKSLAKVGSSSTSVPDGAQDRFGSRDLVFKDVLNSLQNETQKMIALCGMGGVGKTTMMEQLKKTVEDTKMFDWVVKVVVGENPDPISIQRAIAEYICKELSETTKDARSDRLSKIFEGMSQKGQKKVLVILDDVWKEFDLKDIGLTSPLPNGFKLMFTSRFEYICTRLGVKTDSIFKLGVLNDAEAKSLFYEIVGSTLSNGDDSELQKIGEDIVRKCGGLPIAIVTIAKSLNGNIKEAWEETLSNLQRHDLQDLDGIVHNVFEMSYSNLKNDDDKSVFLLSGLFPDDFDIIIEDLMRYGWGLRLFTKVHTLAEARRRANICVNNLIRANLLTESDRKGCVKMHDLVRAFVLSNFSKIKQASIINHNHSLVQQLPNDGNESLERILLQSPCMSEFPADFNYPNLSFFMLMDGYKLLKFPEDFYERMKKLEVVCYENMITPLLPVTFEHSSNLRTLCFRSCELINEDISFLGNISNLEILSFAECSVRRLPSSIGKLKKLKLLDLSECVDLSIDDGVFQNLDSLEELYMRASKGRPVRFTQANCNELEKLSQHLFALELEFYKNKVESESVSFKKLERFRISIGCDLDYGTTYSFREALDLHLEYDNHYSIINTLDLVANCDKLVECKISELFEKVEELHIEVFDMNHLEDVSMHHSFSSLRFLHVSMCTNLTYMFSAAVASGLTKLEKLTISWCPKLTKMVSENVGVGVIKLPKLKILYLKHLPKLVCLCDNVIKFPELMELKLYDIPNFMSIYPNNNDTSTMKSLLNKEVVVPKLEKLSIDKMPNLKQIWPGEISPTEKHSVSMLRHITVINCNSLMNLFPCNPLPLLSHLEELEVDNCDSIEVLFNIDLKNVSEMEGYGSSTLRSITVSSLRKLKELWRIKCHVNKCDNILISGFKYVETIHIERCYEFEYIFSPVTTNFDLTSLTTYVTKNTDRDIQIWRRNGKEINVSYPSYILPTFHHLQHLKLENDEKVKVVFEMDHQPPLQLPYLKVVELSRLHAMSHVWKCNRNKLLIPHLHQPFQSPFENLREIFVYSCHKIKYLFSRVMVKYLPNLEGVKVESCGGIEEISSSRDDEYDDNTTSTYSYKNPIFFPHLDVLELKSLSCLNRIDGGDARSDQDQFQSTQVSCASWSLCQYPREISITSCDALSSLIPWYAVGKMEILEKLNICDCKMLIEVFESATMNKTDSIDEGSEHGGGVTLTSATLETITTRAPQFSNLKVVYIDECDLLSYLFTFSTLESLKQLKELTVTRCKMIQVIVKEENEASSKEVAFPRLETLKLGYLPNLKAFFLGMNESRWPFLVNVVIKDCPQLMVFASGQSKTPKLKYIRTCLGKHSIECGLNFQTINQTTFPSSSNPTISKGTPCSFHNLVDLVMKNKDGVRSTIIPSKVLLQLQNLERVKIVSCSGLKVVFPLSSKAKNISGLSVSQTVVKIPNLREVYLEWLDDLRYVWNNHQWMTLEFPNLTSLSIYVCNSLNYVFTSSMVGSLVQLQDLVISDCMNIEVIVSEVQRCDDNVNEIMLPRLKSITLCKLPRLSGFYLGKVAFSLTSLDTLEIEECPSFEVFTRGHLATPELKVMDTSFGMYYVHGDLNSFAKTRRF